MTAATAATLTLATTLSSIVPKVAAYVYAEAPLLAPVLSSWAHALVADDIAELTDHDLPALETSATILGLAASDTVWGAIERLMREAHYHLAGPESIVEVAS